MKFIAAWHSLQLMKTFNTQRYKASTISSSLGFYLSWLDSLPGAWDTGTLALQQFVDRPWKSCSVPPPPPPGQHLFPLIWWWWWWQRCLLGVLCVKFPYLAHETQSGNLSITDLTPSLYLHGQCKTLARMVSQQMEIKQPMGMLCWKMPRCGETDYGEKQKYC